MFITHKQLESTSHVVFIPVEHTLWREQVPRPDVLLRLLRQQGSWHNRRSSGQGCTVQSL